MKGMFIIIFALNCHIYQPINNCPLCFSWTFTLFLSISLFFFPLLVYTKQNRYDKDKKKTHTIFQIFSCLKSLGRLTPFSCINNVVKWVGPISSHPHKVKRKLSQTNKQNTSQENSVFATPPQFCPMCVWINSEFVRYPVGQCDFEKKLYFTASIKSRHYYDHLKFTVNSNMY